MLVSTLSWTTTTQSQGMSGVEGGTRGQCVFGASAAAAILGGRRRVCRRRRHRLALGWLHAWNTGCTKGERGRSQPIPRAGKQGRESVGLQGEQAQAGLAARLEHGLQESQAAGTQVSAMVLLCG